MCDPVSGIMAVTTALSLAQKQSMANTQAKHARIGLRRKEANKRAEMSHKASLRVREGRRQRARITASASERGIDVGSANLDLQRSQSDFLQGEDIGNMKSFAERGFRDARESVDLQIAGSGVSGFEVAAGVAGVAGSYYKEL